MPSLVNLTNFWLFYGLIALIFQRNFKFEGSKQIWNISEILIRWNLKKGGFSVDANRLFFVYKSLLHKVKLGGLQFLVLWFIFILLTAMVNN